MQSSAGQRMPTVAAFAVIAGILLSLNGIWWSWAETWHPDQMAFHQLLHEDRAPLEPPNFLKPPFHTYVNFMLAVVPVELVERAAGILTGRKCDFNHAAVWVSKFLQMAFFAGIIYLVWRCCAESYGALSANIVALVLATSAGFIVQTHFLTADIPVTFWMLASFRAAQPIPADDRLKNYVVAGLLAGIAAATKYNGIVVALAILVFHIAGHQRDGIVTLLLNTRLTIAFLMVVMGFVLANPYALMNSSTFLSDFLYNYYTTPLYEGVTGKTSYSQVLPRLSDIVGWPMAIVIFVGLAVLLVQIVRSREWRAHATAIAAFSVTALYIAKFGAAPRLPVRFLLPVVPFLLMGTAFLWQMGCRRKWLLLTIVALITTYNVAASAWTGRRFAFEARMQALEWASQSMPVGSSVESTISLPQWSVYPRLQVTAVHMPNISGRLRQFTRFFHNDTDVLHWLYTHESDDRLDWYTREALEVRRPDFIALSSQYFHRFLSGSSAEAYPEMRYYFATLLSGDAGYVEVFRSQGVSPVRWLYPHDIEFVDATVIVLRRADPSAAR